LSFVCLLAFVVLERMYSFVLMCLCRVLTPYIGMCGSIFVDIVSNICIAVQYIYVTLNTELNQVM
jgi:hypothetical protein